MGIIRKWGGSNPSQLLGPGSSRVRGGEEEEEEERGKTVGVLVH